MDGLLVGAALGLGVLLVFDALTRPGAKQDPGKWAAKLGPKGLAAAVCAGTVLAVTQVAGRRPGRRYPGSQAAFDAGIVVGPSPRGLPGNGSVGRMVQARWAASPRS